MFWICLIGQNRALPKQHHPERLFYLSNNNNESIWVTMTLPWPVPWYHDLSMFLPVRLPAWGPHPLAAFSSTMIATIKPLSVLYEVLFYAVRITEPQYLLGSWPNLGSSIQSPGSHLIGSRFDMTTCSQWYWHHQSKGVLNWANFEWQDRYKQTTVQYILSVKTDYLVALLKNEFPDPSWFIPIAHPISLFREFLEN